MIYKYLSLLLFVLLLLGGGVFLYKDHKSNKEKTNLYNQIVKLEGSVKEANNAMSARGVEVDNLRSALNSALSDNQELAKNIKQRDEKIISLTNVVLSLKSKHFDIPESKEEVIVDKDNNTRIKVEFDQTKDSLKLSGYTLTNPPYASIQVDWIKDLNLTLVLVRDEEKHYKAYIDSKNSDAVPVNLNLSIDPSIFERKWYEKIGIGTDVSVGYGLMTSLKVFYDIRNNMFVGPNVIFDYDGKKMRTLYGGSVGFYPFR